MKFEIRFHNSKHIFLLITPYIFSESPEKPKTAAKKRKSSPVAKSKEKPAKKVKEEVKEAAKEEAKEEETTPDTKSESDKKKRRS